MASGTKSRALLHQAERGLTVGIERYHFAIEDRCLRFDEARHIFQLGITRSQFILIPRDQSHLAVFDKRDRAIAVPFDFK